MQALPQLEGSFLKATWSGIDPTGTSKHHLCLARLLPGSLAAASAELGSVFAGSWPGGSWWGVEGPAALAREQDSSLGGSRHSHSR